MRPKRIDLPLKLVRVTPIVIRLKHVEERRRDLVLVLHEHLAPLSIQILLMQHRFDPTILGSVPADDVLRTVSRSVIQDNDLEREVRPLAKDAVKRTFEVVRMVVADCHHGNKGLFVLHGAIFSMPLSFG